ncbi:hypothetical protein LCGC14_0234920 [marine sediment metagenome]|uniref:Uncharacterized protein n=1 Tax=marine sediment metagenome TaxID=412755 RepID=A0A0F9WTL7_9ZZZZ
MKPAKEHHVENGRIMRTMLGVEHHGLLTASIQMEFSGSGQSYNCPYRLDGGPPVDSRFPDNYFANKIRELLDTLGVDSWEEIPGAHVRVIREDPYGEIMMIGHIVKDKWFSWKPEGE